MSSPPVNGHGALHPSLSPEEAMVVAQAAPQLGEAAEDYIAVPVQVQMDRSREGAIVPMQTPQGVVDMVLVPLLLAMPVSNLRATRVLQADGKMPFPLQGMLPIMAARLVLPRRRVRPDLLAALGLSETPVEAAAEEGAAANAPPLPPLLRFPRDES